MALDTETTGLQPYLGAKLFSLVVTDERDSYYFNFQPYPNVLTSFVLDLATSVRLLSGLFGHADILWYLHNAKFDLAFLSNLGIELAGQIHDTEAIARVEYNQHMEYGLDACAKRIGFSKDDAVEKYIKEHKLYEKIPVPGKKQAFVRKFYERVPYDIISRYACLDGSVTWQLGRSQEEKLEAIHRSLPEGRPSPLSILQTERQLTKTLFEMERVGIRIDKDYCEKALAHEEKIIAQAADEFEAYTGVKFVDSNKVLAEAFTKMGEAFPKTEKGNPSFTDDVLMGYDTPVAEIIRRYRTAAKQANTYYRNFLTLCDEAGAIHPSIRQGGTATGRVSCANPNLQNLTGETSDIEYPVRKAFIPREDFIFAMLDYDQMEYRLMLDYANEREVIKRILEEGLDVHEAIAQKFNRPRKQAKTLNFGILYGMGLDALGSALGVDRSEASFLRSEYFAALPSVARFIREVQHVAETRGHIFNWAGRVCHFPDPRFAYKAPNHLIQGGCADVVKIAMNECAAFLKKSQTKSRLVLQIHDELLFEIHKSELTLIPQLQAIMAGVYPQRHIPLTCSVAWSDKSWGDKIEGMP